MPNEKVVITENDFNKALLLIPIILEMGAVAARRFVLKNAMTSDELIAKAQELNADTERRNKEFADRLAAEREN